MAEEIEEEYDYGDEDIVTLVSPDGEEMDFAEIAQIEYEGKTYSLLQPLEELEDGEEDDVYVFRLFSDENGEENFEYVSDDAVIDAVFEEYNRLADAEENG